MNYNRALGIWGYFYWLEDMGLLAEIIQSFDSLSFGYVRNVDRKCAQHYTMCVCVCVNFLLFEFVTTQIGDPSFNRKVVITN